jgi:hypothetical protein
VIVHTGNPSYWGGRDRRTVVIAFWTKKPEIQSETRETEREREGKGERRKRERQRERERPLFWQMNITTDIPKSVITIMSLEKCAHLREN